MIQTSKDFRYDEYEKTEVCGHIKRINESEFRKKINYFAKVKATTKWVEKTCGGNWGESNRERGVSN